MNNLNPSRKPAAVPRAGGYMKHPNSISFGFVITFVLAGCLAATGQGAFTNVTTVVTPVGSLNSSRESHTATLLPSGQVLVAGGIAVEWSLEGGLAGAPQFNVFKSAELYDPVAGAWTYTGNLGTARYNHTATLLPNGKVLVAGGYGDTGILASAELYDPATGVWSSTGSLNDARVGHTATLLPSGKVLVAGGSATNSAVLASAELYDPATGFWTRTGSLGTARESDTTTLLPNGQVLVAGGQDVIGDTFASAELYNPATGVWSPTGSLGAARYSHTATLLTNGQVLVAGGGGTNGTVLTSAELYDPATGVWTPTGSLNAARGSHTATLVANGQVLILGGGDGSGEFLGAELYDPAAATWTASSNAIAPVGGDTATLLPSGQVLVAGGEGTDLNIDTDNEYSYALDYAALYATPGFLTTYNTRSGYTATLLSNGKVLVAGGEDESNSFLASAELYDPASGAWTPTGSMGTARFGHAATLLPNGKVLITGGDNWGDVDSIDGFYASAELYDPATGVWSPTGSMGTARSGHTATLLSNGKVLVAGGEGTNSFSASAELYDPATGNWTTTGSMATWRYIHTATLLSNGKVLVAGGDDDVTAELYDPATGTWTLTGSLATGSLATVQAYYNFTATLLPNGKVLVAGGNSSDPDTYPSFVASAELYDPATGTWTPTGSMATPHTVHTATLLPNGKVLVVGGYATNVTILASAELYDPATGAWSPAGSLADVRAYQTATLLPNGKVLVLGGNNAASFGELYNTRISFPSLVKLGDGSFQFGFINGSGPIYSVLANTNLSATVNAWTNLGTATEMPVGSGLFQFTDHQAPNHPQRFYRVSSP